METWNAVLQLTIFSLHVLYIEYFYMKVYIILHQTELLLFPI